MNNQLFAIKKLDSNEEPLIMGVNTAGEGYFKGEIQANAGKFGDAEIKNNTPIYVPDLSVLPNSTSYETVQSTVLKNCVIISNDYGMYADEYDDPINDSTEETDEYVHGNILDLENNLLQIGNTKVCPTGIQYSFIRKANDNNNNNNIHTSTIGTNWWNLDVDGLAYYEKRTTSSRGNNTYYYNNSSIKFTPGTSSNQSQSSENNYDTAKNNSNILYSTDGYHEFTGQYIKLPTIKCTGTIYNSSGVAVTSDQNKKHAIEDPDERYISLFDELEIKRFKYNDGTSNRYHLGAIAQPVEEAMKKIGLTNEEFAGIVNDNGNYYIRYDELNMLTALKVKEMEQHYNKIIESLYEEISKLKEEISVLNQGR